MKTQFHIACMLALTTILVLAFAFRHFAIVVLFAFIVFTNLAIVFGPIVVGGFALAFRPRDQGTVAFYEDRFKLIALFSWLLCVSISAVF